MFFLPKCSFQQHTLAAWQPWASQNWRDSHQQRRRRRDCSFSLTPDQKALKACISNYIWNYKKLISLFSKYEGWSFIRTSRTELDIKCHLLMASEKVLGVSTTVVGLTGNADICWMRVPTITWCWSQFRLLSHGFWNFWIWFRQCLLYFTDFQTHTSWWQNVYEL